VDNVSVAQFYVEGTLPPPEVCGDVEQATWTPIVQFSYEVPQPPIWQRKRWRLRRELGPVTDGYSTPVLVYAPYSALQHLQEVNFEQYDLWAVTGSFESATPPSYPFDSDQNAGMAAQYWAHVPQPTGIGGFASDSGYSTSGPRLTLTWTYGHGGGGQYKTRIDEGSSPGTKLKDSLPGTTQSYVTSSAYGVTRRFWLRHFSRPAPQNRFELTTPVSPYAGPADIYVPPRLTAWIDGPDGIGESGAYTWDATPGGGTPGYHFRWLFQEGGCCNKPIQVVGRDTQILARLIEQRETFWFFRLIVTEWDSYFPKRFWADSANMILVFVDAEGWGGAPLGAASGDTGGTAVAPEQPLDRRRGLVDLDGGCRAIPEDRAERQRLYRRLWQRDDVAACWAAVATSPTPGP
jgi:hypothetical protein